MAKGQTEIQQQNTQLAQQNAANAADDRQRLLLGTPEEQARRKRVAARRSAIDKGNYGNLPDFIGNNASVADRFRKRQAIAGLTPTGNTSLGLAYTNPKALAQSNQLLNDQWERDASGQFESDVRNYIQDTDDMEQGIIRHRTDIDNALLGNASSRSLDHYNLAAQIAGRRGSWLPSLIGGGLGAVGGLLANPAI